MEYKVCKSEELPNNSMKAILIQGNMILVCRSNDRLFALDNSCPHRGASLSKSDMKGTKIICYMHDFEYDLVSGKLLHIPSKWQDQTLIGLNLEICYSFQYLKRMGKSVLNFLDIY
jgi:nitrite reductase/ring-hydroxylating ferredoxin subunit